jgi:hypothetical protein
MCVQYASQQQLPLHDYWLAQADEFRTFQKEATSLHTDILPQMQSLTNSVGKLTQNIQQLEEVLIILLENKEEQTRQEWKMKQEKELQEQKTRFLSVHGTRAYTARTRRGVLLR